MPTLSRHEREGGERVASEITTRSRLIQHHIAFDRVNNLETESIDQNVFVILSSDVAQVVRSVSHPSNIAIGHSMIVSFFLIHHLFPESK